MTTKLILSINSDDQADKNNLQFFLLAMIFCQKVGLRSWPAKEHRKAHLHLCVRNMKEIP